jgi:phosphoribosylformylglycinamidine synthase PurS subunit
MMYTANIQVMPLNELLDPQGKAVNNGLHNLGLTSIQDVRIGKHILLSIEASTKEEAFSAAQQACEKMLHNAVMERYEIEIM